MELDYKSEFNKWVGNSPLFNTLSVQGKKIAYISAKYMLDNESAIFLEGGRLTGKNLINNCAISFAWAMLHKELDECKKEIERLRGEKDEQLMD